MFSPQFFNSNKTRCTPENETKVPQYFNCTLGPTLFSMTSNQSASKYSNIGVKKLSTKGPSGFKLPLFGFVESILYLLSSRR